MFRIIEGRCRICKRDLRLETDMDCPKEWSEKLLPMATCNRCHDLMTERNRAIEGVKRECENLMVLRHKKVKNSQAVSDAIQKRLSFFLQRYAAVIARYYHKEVNMETGPAIDLIFEDPRHWWRTLNDYRDEVKKLIHAQTEFTTKAA